MIQCTNDILIECLWAVHCTLKGVYWMSSGHVWFCIWRTSFKCP